MENRSIETALVTGGADFICARAHDITQRARQINDYMPQHILKMIAKALKCTGKEVRGSKIAVLGTAYKGNVSDSRLSPSKIIIHELTRLGAEVTAYDPYCNENFGAKKANSLNEAIKNADCIAIITDHTPFKKLKLQEIKALMNEKPAIIDARRILDPYEGVNTGFIYYGIGFGERATEQK